MKNLLLAVAVVLAGMPARASGVDSEPPTVAQRAVRAIAENDAAALARVAHPELIRRMRSSRLVVFYLSSRNESTDLTRASDDGVIRLFCEAHKTMTPQDPRCDYVSTYVRTDVRGEFAVVTLASGWRSKISKQLNQPVEEIVLKKSADQWLFLWSPVINVHVDLEWDPRTEIPGRLSLKPTAETSTSAFPITPGDLAFLAQVLQAVRARDARWLANHTLYPIVIKARPEQRTINNPQEFAAILSSELTPEFVQEFCAAAAQPLFANWRGVMAGRGILWFGRFGSPEQRAGCSYSILSIGGFAFQASDEIARG